MTYGDISFCTGIVTHRQGEMGYVLFLCPFSTLCLPFCPRPVCVPRFVSLSLSFPLCLLSSLFSVSAFVYTPSTVFYPVYFSRFVSPPYFSSSVSLTLSHCSICRLLFPPSVYPYLISLSTFYLFTLTFTDLYLSPFSFRRMTIVGLSP